MDVRVKLFTLDEQAADGSYFSEEIVREYLNSDIYKNKIKNKTMLGGITHRDRVKEPESGMGRGDHCLLAGNLTHYITGIELDGDSVYAHCNILNASDNESNEYVKTLNRLLKEGVKLSLSVSVQGAWSHDGRAEKINDIEGFDFTLDPSFKSARVVGVYN